MHSRSPTSLGPAESQSCWSLSLSPPCLATILLLPCLWMDFLGPHAEEQHVFLRPAGFPAVILEVLWKQGELGSGSQAPLTLTLRHPRSSRHCPQGCELHILICSTCSAPPHCQPVPWWPQGPAPPPRCSGHYAGPWDLEGNEPSPRWPAWPSLQLSCGCTVGPGSDGTSTALLNRGQCASDQACHSASPWVGQLSGPRSTWTTGEPPRVT